MTKRQLLTKAKIKRADSAKLKGIASQINFIAI